MPALLSLQEGPSVLLDKPILLFGRDLECDVRFDSRKISRKHCCLAQVSDYLVVRDLGSTNGIRINGVRVLESRLRPGDELTIGNLRYQVRWDEQAMAPRRAARAEAGPLPKPPDATEQAHDDAMLEMCDEPVPLSESAVGLSLPEAEAGGHCAHHQAVPGRRAAPMVIRPSCRTTSRWRRRPDGAASG